MDELVHHCLRELAFDGDLGCQSSRLRDFVVSYHQDSHEQVVDDAYFAFVWSLVVRQPTVRVGTVPDGATTEVYVAPQQSQKKKSKEKVEGGDTSSSSVASLTLLPDARARSLDDLQLHYGDTLRVAVDAETSFAAITGSHIRPPKLTPMVYTALQFITRGREHGIGIVNLGKKTGYDQKTCFYLIKQLLELELVVKLRRGGVGTNFCIHKHFFEHSPLWRQIQDEGVNLSKDPQAEGGGIDNEETSLTHDGSQAPVQFDPIDGRHLSSLSLVQSRIVKLLKHSDSHTHPSQNLLVTIGFSNPTKPDRRFFQSRLRELIENRVVERVMVPSMSKSGPASVPCIRLVSDNDNLPNEPSESPTQITQDPSAHGVRDGRPTTIKLNITLHKQITDLLEKAGSNGMTLSEISRALGNFDRRTLELLLTKLDKSSPPSHLSDLRIVQLMETHGRERRWRYFTFASYREIIANEKLDDQDGPYSSVDFSNVGNFAPFVAEDFYTDVAELNRITDYAFSKTGKVEDVGEEVALKRVKTIAMPTLGSSGLTVSGKKRKRGEAGLDADGDGEASHTPRKRGRPRKHPVENQHGGTDAAGKVATRTSDNGHSRQSLGENTEATQQGATSTADDRHSPSSRVLRKRRRPPDDSVVPEASKPTKGERRGRPRKRPPSPPPVDETMDHLPPQNDVHPSHVHVGSKAAEAQSTPKGRDVALQYTGNAEVSAQPELISSVPPCSHSLEAPGMATGIVDDNQHDLTQPAITMTVPVQGRTEIVGGPETEGGIAQMNTPPGPSIPIDHILGKDSGKAPEAERADSVMVPQKQKEKPVTSHSRSNVSLLRRENEFLKILEQSGGIVYPGSKEFLEAHVALLDTLSSAGEPTSGLAGIKVDKRTIENTFESLENRGKVKVLKTAITTVTGAQRSARIVYLPTVDQSRLDASLAELGKGHHGTPFSATTPAATSVPPGDPKRPAQPLKHLQSERGADKIGSQPKSSDRADQFFQSDVQTIRDALLTERTTLAQLYGFLPGKMMRARELHLATLDSFKLCHDPPISALAAKRVVNFSQYFRKFPVGIYCSLVSTLVQNDELSQILSTEEGRRTLIQDLPQSLQTLLQIGRARSRERFIELFEILQHLSLVAPLQPSDSPNPLICCESNGEHPSSFDPFAGVISSTSYRTAPDYWLFHQEAALHLWVLSTASPPFWKMASVSTRLDASNYWNELQPACTNKAFAQSATRGSPSQDIAPDYSFARSIIRETSWNGTYELSRHQRQYLKRFISRWGDDAPLEDEGDPFIEKVSWTVSAPLSVVKDFLQKERASQLRELDRARLRTPGNEGNEEGTERMAQEKELLVKKVADAKARKEREWEAILNVVHPGVLEGAAATRVARVRKRYLQSGVSNDRSRWEGEVRDAIRESRGAAKAVLPSAQRAALVRPPQGLPSVPVALPPQITAAQLRPAGLPQPVANQPGKSIEQLISEQGPAREDTKRKKRKDTKTKDANAEGENGDDEDSSQRKSRFLWNNDYDELAQDAHAILRVRLREVGGRMDWVALRQIFPAVPRNSVRQRIASLREIPNNELYMKRLEDQWHRLWKQYRSTEHLPDHNPKSQTDFDLIKHLQFLRKFVDKNALRVGFQETSTTLMLPETVSQLHASWDVIIKLDDTPVWDFLWDSKVDENREKGLLQTAFTANHDDMTKISDGSRGGQDVQIAEAALKMVFGTPNESYVPSRGAALLRSASKHTVSRAKDGLLGRGVLSKLVKDSQKPKPGRTLKISEINQNALGGSIPQELFHEATTLDALYRQQEAWREWPLRASDGDLAMLLQMASEGLVDFGLDITRAKTARIEIDWNSKKADDDHIETTIFTRSSSISMPNQEDPAASRAHSPSVEEDDNEHHGKTADGTVACCRQYSDGQVNCDSCLSAALKAWALESNTKEQEVSCRILNTLDEAGPAGLDISTLLTNTTGEGGCTEVVLSALSSLMNNHIPLVVLVGHSRVLVVSAHHSDAWTVTVSEEPRINILPRRWLDVTGAKMRDTWRAALRAVIGTIVFRPGISQAEIVWRLRSVYERVEVIEVLRELYENGFVRRRIGTNEVVHEMGLVTVREEEEKAVYWFLGDRRWYRAPFK